MMDIIFPPVQEANEDGVLAIGGDYGVSTLLNAYSQGIFPWPISDKYPLAWFSPDPRGVLFIDDLHISKSLKRFLNKNRYTCRFNTDFEAVINKCANVVRSDQSSTWITKELKDSYIALFNAGHAYSTEIYDESDNLVGGIYGVCIGGFVSGESMFHTKDNASKFALVSLIRKLKQKKIELLDTQMVTNITEAMGAVDIDRSVFIEKLQIKRPLTREAIFND
jgi:leucyl/phenylalanyl-tRNA--protein transferase